MSDQWIIQAILIAAFLLIAVIIVRPNRSARGQALRTISTLLLFAIAIVFILFPGIPNQIAGIVGVGRGTDLLLYLFLVAFVGHMFSSGRKRRHQDRQVTELARRFALANVNAPMPPGSTLQQPPNTDE